MAHRVVQLDSELVDSTTADSKQTDIKNQLDSGNYEINERNVNTGSKTVSDGEIKTVYTLGVVVECGLAKDGNNLFDWIKNYIQNNSSAFEQARLRIHDCKHGSDESKPCSLGNVWTL
jgi:hypothetical protein